MGKASTAITNVDQFTAAMLESARDHPNDRWVVARTRSSERPTWLAGFDAAQPVWVLKVEEAAIYDRKGAEGVRLRCTGLPDLDDVLYAVCQLMGDNPFMGAQ